MKKITNDVAKMKITEKTVKPPPSVKGKVVKEISESESESESSEESRIRIRIRSPRNN